MRTRIAIVEGFYPKPQLIREAARKAASFRELPGFIGWRSEAFFPRRVRDRIERKFDLTISEFPQGQQAFEHGNGIFFRAFSQGKHREGLVVHTDDPRAWSTVIVYLTPNAPVNAGTSFWRHRRTGLVTWPTHHAARRLGISLSDIEALLIRDQARLDRWEETDRVGNIFNRALLFPGRLFHSASRHFGRDLDHGRIFHRFRFQQA